MLATTIIDRTVWAMMRPGPGSGLAAASGLTIPSPNHATMATAIVAAERARRRAEKIDGAF
jgi:hypothetical protein